MKCPECQSKMKKLDEVDMENKPTYRLYFCENIECFNSIETIDGKIIGEEAKILFIPEVIKWNEIVLDNVIGSGTTAVACLRTNRQFIGFEKEEEYYHIAIKRIGKFNKEYYEELPEEEKPKQRQFF